MFFPLKFMHRKKIGFGGLFAGYVNSFLRLKQQADGWPNWAKTDAEKEKYIKDYGNVEVKIEQNPGMRALAKLMLNSFWGKFGQRSNVNKLEYFDEPEGFFRTIFDKTKTIKNVQFYGEKLACVTYCNEDDFVDVLPNTNVVIAAYVTAQARLKLYSYLEKLQERVLYMGTDSIIYGNISKLN